MMMEQLRAKGGGLEAPTVCDMSFAGIRQLEHLVKDG